MKTSKSTLKTSALLMTSVLTFGASEAVASTELEFSGKILGAVIADSDVSGLGANNVPNGLYGANDESNIAIDTTLTRLNLGTFTPLEGDESLRSFVSIDFNGSNNGKMDLRFREAYVNWNLAGGALLVGQTWSTLMDLNRFPDTVLEPTLSGVVFTRQPMVRWSQRFGTVRYDLALESGTNAHVTTDNSETELDNISDVPDFIAAIQTDTDQYWLRAAGLISHIKTTSKDDDKTYSDNGWAVHLSGGIKFNEKDHFQIAYFNSRGNDRYVLGVSQTGPLFNEQTGEFHLRESQSLWTAVGHSWTENLKSTIGYGIWQADEFSWQKDTFTETQFALANLKWNVRPSLTLGIEYNYTSYERSESDERDNHRVIFAADYAF
ncbi:DcaP family trimeric outer membrane transporter [Vibrio breoganii]|uniref:DcaP family trimeric outer membrane transporter n=1 Tax=Vibrio breoganii TaxID=553239 RepID=UPI0003097E80|nr:DcaP family trimeric outer membrane transporter [Vibrio breoganii]OED94056.1 hypothetical protein A1QG_04720 [Vibrio breoganii ZF-29]OEF84629.1 hypothetical protein B003_06795 [Vibrio breoganii 1C10]PMK73178.1 hypothetical protein BCT94_12360 [Vibrio breoganii]PMO98626.1 hypothetical protein BCS95_02940 [Vibrio breoganii]